MVAASKKDLSVETLRGFAIILVVLGHVIGSDKYGGMQVKDDSFLRYLYYTFEYLRMPLFTVISGWVYALKPVNLDFLKDFSIKKVRRLLLPMIFVGGVYYLLRYFTPGTNDKDALSEIWTLFIFPYMVYWYLPSLFLVFILVGVLDSYKLFDKISGWLIAVGLAFVLLFIRNRFITGNFENYFSFQGAIYLLPYFIIGVGIKRFKRFFSNKVLNSFLLAIFIFGIMVQQASWFELISYKLEKSDGIGLLIGLTGTILFFRLKWNIKWLVWFGSYAYSIYLFHSFGTAGGRIIIKTAGVSSPYIIFFISLALGLLLPVAAEIIFDKFQATRMLLLGRGLKRKK
jgi:glucan biosynthesis protein C